ncbi:MAG: nucleotidyltransferase family protein [Lachnospiraceae bacterium]|nr:nucleotidyltransferase family protein [Lachnospiraceae bacterium]
MKVTGIIAELNPMHDGHKVILNEALKDRKDDDALIMVMSGNFVQRGEPAIHDKFKRTKQALEAGVDIVVEIPTVFALSSAESFARSGIALLDRTGIVDDLIFGVEELYDEDSFFRLCKHLVEEPEEYRLVLRNELKKGVSFPVARAAAIKDSIADIPEELYTSPNNILALEYGKAISYFKSDISMHPIKRETDISAHRIREEMYRTKKHGIYIDDFTQAFGIRHWSKQKDYGDDIFKRFLHLYSYDKQLTDLIDVMENKSVTRTRISRMLFRYMLGLPSIDNCSHIEDYAPYLRVLGFRRDSDWVLREMHDKAKVPIIQKIVDDTVGFSDYQQQVLDEDLMAHELYRLISIQKYPNGVIKDDYAQGMVII